MSTVALTVAYWVCKMAVAMEIDGLSILLKWVHIIKSII